MIAEQLRTAIMYGRLAPGEQLIEADLAEQLGVSRGPLREATQRLVQEGLLHAIRNRGVFVVELSTNDVADIYVARQAIEQAAAKEVLTRDPLASADRLALAHADMYAAAERGDPVALSNADQRFHEILVEESGSPRLRRMASTVLVESRMCMTALESKYHLPAEAVREHLDIVEAIRNRNAKQVLNSIDAHMRTAVRLLTPEN